MSRLSVGCAMWSLPSWEGRYVPAGLDRAGALTAYATWCNAVEGNTTFYALPTATTVARWRESTPDGFEFCFKLPRAVTHDRRLRRAGDEVTEFLARVAPLGPRLGPIWVQLPPSFGPVELPALDTFLGSRPTDHAWAVEVRHRAFEAGGAGERQLNDLLFRHGVDRVLIDTRAVFAGPRETSAEVEAFERKPRLRVRPVALHSRPTVRFIGQTDLGANRSYWQPWAAKVADWIADGREPMVFLHTPDNVVAPDVARQFHDAVAARVPDLDPLPEPVAPDVQLGMFGDS